MKRAIALAVVAVALAGCTNPPPSAPRVATETPAHLGRRNAREELVRAVRAYTMRLRNVRCDGVALGSGFAIDKRTIVTNRHVVEFGSRLEVDTWDGRSLAVASVEQAVGADLALVHLAEDAPAVAPKMAAKDPKVDTQLYLLGYPGGNPARASKGRVVDYPTDPRYDAFGKVMELTGHAIGGNSGGPLFDKQGRIVGVVFAIQLRDGWVMAMPVSRLRALLDGGPREPVVPC
jgi:S1-C subfamily serine protease